MEENKLKEDIERVNLFIKYANFNGVIDFNDYISNQDIEAFENILNELERLQKEFEVLDRECSRLEQKEIELEKEIEDWQKAYQEEKDEQFNMLINNKCLHCNENTPLYCEKCQQDLITKNAELQLENEELKQDNSKQWKERCKLSFEVDDSIPKQVIRDKIQELEEEYKKYIEKWAKSGMNKEHPFYRYIVRLEAQIEILEELLGE